MASPARRAAASAAVHSSGSHHACGVHEGQRLQRAERRRSRPQRASASVFKIGAGSAVGGTRPVRDDAEPAHRAAARQHHRETQTADLDRLAAARHAAELVRDQTADGVEVVLGQVQAEGFVDAVDRGVAGDAVGAVGQRVDVAFVVAVVELVLDLADDLLEHVLDRDQPGGAGRTRR